MLRTSRLKVARISAGYTQGELAELTRTYQSRISRLELGEKAPTDEEIVTLSTALEVDVDLLFPPQDETRR